MAKQKLCAISEHPLSGNSCHQISFYFKLSKSICLNCNPDIIGHVQEMTDTIYGQWSALSCAVEIGFKRGATDRTRLNYPDQYAALIEPICAK